MNGMMASVVSRLPPPQQVRFHRAYTDKRRPLGWWDPSANGLKRYGLAGHGTLDRTATFRAL